MPRILGALIRHGDYRQPKGMPSAHLPYGLTDEGREQARGAVAEILALTDREGWTLAHEFHSSHMRRAFETATILAKGLGRGPGGPFEVKETDALAERSVGAAANLTQDQIAAIVQDDPRYDPLPEGWKASSHFRLPFQGAESMLEAGHRVATFVQERLSSLAQSATSDTLQIFVGHGGAFRHAAHVLGLLDLDDVRGLSMYHCTPVVIERLDAGTFRHVGGEWKVRRSTTD